MTARSLRAAPMVLLLVGITLLLIQSTFATPDRTLAARDRTSDRPWAPHVETIDGALREGRTDLAVRAWHDAYSAALGSQTWDGMVAAGDAYLRIGAASPVGSAFRAQARQSYLVALYRARAAASVDGVLRVARAFEALGDDEVVAMCVRIATDVAARSPSEADRALVRRYTGPTAVAVITHTP